MGILHSVSAKKRIIPKSIKTFFGRGRGINCSRNFDFFLNHPQRFLHKNKHIYIYRTDEIPATFQF